MIANRTRAAARRLALAVLVLATATALAAPARAADLAAGWQERLDKADQALRRGESKKAARALRDVLAEMSEKLTAAPAGAPWLARVEAALALAEAGLGDPASALWDWSVAVQLAPGLDGLDLEPYGEAGTRLAAARSAAAAPAAAADGVSVPERKRGKPVAYPLSRLKLCDTTPIEVSVTVGTDGVPRSPRLDPARDAVLSWTLLETVRAWRFAPGTRGGQPVAAPFTLRSALTRDDCRDRLARQRRSGPGGEADEGGDDEGDEE